MNVKVETREEKFLPRFKIEGELIFTSATRYPVFLDKFPNFAAINYRRKWRGSEAANESKHGERRVGEKEKKESSPPPCSENPSAMGGNKSKFRIINNARGRIVRVPRFPGVNQLLLFSPARSFPTGDDEQIRGVTRGC